MHGWALVLNRYISYFIYLSDSLEVNFFFGIDYYYYYIRPYLLDHFVVDRCFINTL